MKGQDSPLMEAMAVNPVNLGPLLTAAVNNLWAWLAVVATAAFRFCSLPTTPSSNSNRSSPVKSGSKKQEDQIQGEPETTSSRDSTRISTTWMMSGDKTTKQEEEGALTRGNNSKELFTICLTEEIENEGDHINHDHDHDNDNRMDGGDEAVVKRWAKATTLMAEMRRAGDLGWYEYQDIRVIDGSVVRLWEDARERNCSPSSKRRRYPGGVNPVPV